MGAYPDSSLLAHSLMALGVRGAAISEGGLPEAYVFASWSLCSDFGGGHPHLAEKWCRPRSGLDA